MYIAPYCSDIGFGSAMQLELSWYFVATTILCYQNSNTLPYQYYVLAHCMKLTCSVSYSCTWGRTDCLWWSQFYTLHGGSHGLDVCFDHPHSRVCVCNTMQRATALQLFWWILGNDHVFTCTVYSPIKTVLSEINACECPNISDTATIILMDFSFIQRNEKGWTPPCKNRFIHTCRNLLSTYIIVGHPNAVCM